MWSASGRFALVFNGEIYNFRVIRDDLKRCGHHFRTSSDTEVLLEAISNWGLDAAVRRLEGMFAFAVWDSHSESLSLCRDRLGIKPCYWRWKQGVFSFASEMKALMALSADPLTVDPVAVEEILAFSYSASPRTIFTEIQQLEPGHILQLPLGGEPSIEAYWTIARHMGQVARAENLATDANLELEFAKVLETVTTDYLSADVPVGCFLSGGIDSSMIAWAATSLSSRRISTFSIGFDEPEWDESRRARAVAQYLGTDHHECILRSGDVLELVEALPEIYDEPFADFSQVPTLALSRFARKHVAVCLSGDGGDELFGGYDRYRWAGPLWNRLGQLPSQRRRNTMDCLRRTPLHELGSVVDRELSRGDTIDTAEEPHSVGNRDTFLRYYRNLMSNGNDGVVRAERRQRNYADDGANAPFGLSWLQQMQFEDMRRYMGDGILTKVDRASMSVGLEVRVPLLDERIVDFAKALPTDLKVTNEASRLFQRRFVRSQFPVGLLDHPKKGFGFPIDRWLRGPLREWAESLLDPSVLSGIPLLRSAVIRKLWNQHQSARTDEHWRLWPILMYVQWFSRMKNCLGTTPLRLR
jgi:asparagine synthase (glutamine-hydrolysing)